MGKTLTAANAEIFLVIPSLFPAPFKLQGFDTDDVFDSPGVSFVETKMGVDGKLSAGFTHAPIEQGFMIQGDSETINFFETWNQVQITTRTAYKASGSVLLPAVKRRYVMTNGYLTEIPVVPTVKKLIGARRFKITWERIVGAPA